MKKRLTSLVMALALCLTLLPTTAWAVETDYGVTVCGVKITSENASNITGTGITGTVSYDSDTETLTLDEASLTHADSAAISSSHDLKIQLKGTNTITVSGSAEKAIHMEKGEDDYLFLTITGDGSLSIGFGSGDRSSAYGIYLLQGSVDIENGATVSVTASTAKVASVGIHADRLTVSDSTVTATGSDTTNTEDSSVSHGISVSWMSISNSTVAATGGKADSTAGNCSAESVGIYTVEAIISGSTVTAIADTATATNGRFAHSFGLGGKSDHPLAITDSTITAISDDAISTGTNSFAYSYGIAFESGTITNSELTTAFGVTSTTREIDKGDFQKNSGISYTDVIRNVIMPATLSDSSSRNGIITIKLMNDITIDTTLQINRAVTLDLNGYVLKYDGETEGSVIQVNKGGDLTLIDSRASDATATHYFTVDEDSGLWTLIADETENVVTGGVITGGTGSLYYGMTTGGGVYVDGGQFTMMGGTIVGCTVTDSGGGVYVADGQFNLNGGAIVGCQAFSGAGVFNDSRFIMDRGTIESCWSLSSGGGVCNTGSFTMADGTIKSCVADSDGGGVYNDGTFTMEGGSAIDCSAIYGSGVYNSNTFNTNGGTVKGEVYLYGTDSYPAILTQSENATSATVFYGGLTNDFYYPGTIDGKLVTFIADDENPYAWEVIHESGTAVEPDAPTKSGYTFGGWYEKDADGTFKASAFDFTSTAITADTTLYAKWTQSSSGGSSRPTYPVTTPDTDNGTVTVDPKNAKSGRTVTVTVTPDSGYTLETLTVLDKNGEEIELTDKGDGTYTFTMPSGKVEVKATFMEDNSMLNHFVDVFPSDYYYDAVLWAAERGITGGVDDTHFGPNLSCTRAQLVTFLWRAAGQPVVNDGMSFTDVDADAYYGEAVRWAASLGIVGGYGNGLFGTGDTITREQMATILYRFAQSMGLDTTQGGMTLREFNDYESISDYAVQAMQWAVDAGIVQGDKGNLMPQGDCTRAQIVTMLYRLLG